MSAAPSLVSVGLEIQCADDPDLFRFETRSVIRVPTAEEVIAAAPDHTRSLRVVRVVNLTEPDAHGHHAYVYCVEMVTPEPDGT